ncbi:hypothetical protein PHYBLDRAFT_68873 [Phycomyces blakesleeanus NRRL 1555(-)]|uniref:Uncharacterized protein n=1 Tax=Phycomyces blakesleeanus (strain ATCC 8743b / DSM 1359 / FGSC 10004 / NBRC 33097 / NRRL 1555) TaxID=763407 RepID=A0A167KKY0_PHYB8|nr:hypothetical protein PHYBLDRAFT_68873 [Phycomyces blakesleeanus NRRL 1555(-)]OAD68326.1 hypothetical protein PHYBLDRAFT_68873 [Phycomyces blakesleeanus NRRL 1555(-)]|eukprot:XP_018286366.1 hypothetical protein PHYBLDRAFT_68873 [Phycomyces blakesleeanus NRRL 1555(-)]
MCTGIWLVEAVFVGFVDTAHRDKEILKDFDEPSAKGLKSNIIRCTKDTLQFEGGKWTKSGAINQIFVPDLKKYTMDAHQIVQGKYKDGDKLRIAGRAASEDFNDLKYIKSQQNSNKDASDFDELIEKVRRLAVYAFASGKTLDEDSKELSIRAIKLPTRARYREDEDDNDKDMAFDQEWVEKIQQARYEESVHQSAVLWGENKAKYNIDERIRENLCRLFISKENVCLSNLYHNESSSRSIVLLERSGKTN